MLRKFSAPRRDNECLRWAFAVLLSLSLLLSFSPPCCIDGEGAGQLISAAQLTCDASDDCTNDKTSTVPAAHQACHCLAHAGTVAAGTATTVDQPRAETLRVAVARLLKAADPASPFEPPRA